MPKTEIPKSDSAKKKTTRRVTKSAAVETAPASTSAAPAAPTTTATAPTATAVAAAAASTNPGPDAIARRAYELWRARGCRMGGEEQQRNWLEAERQLANERTRGPAQN